MAARMTGVQIRGLTKTFHRGASSRRALDALDLDLPLGSMVAVVGGSGCGKSTLAKILTGLIPADAGQVLLPDGTDLVTASPRRAAATRPSLQMVFQDPFGAFDPRLPVGVSLQRFLRRTAEVDVPGRLAASMREVGLQPEHLSRRPGQLSGGQLQRIALVRALLPDPTVLVADEVISALDGQMADEILALLADRRAVHRVMLVISHDLSAVLRWCDIVAVMDRGRIVEVAPADSLAGQQKHAVTRALFDAIPAWPFPSTGRLGPSREENVDDDRR